MTKSECEEKGRTENIAESNKCPECGSAHLVRDYARGEIYCETCGLVTADGIVTDEPEWRSYNPEQAEKRSRTGLPYTYTLHDGGLSTEISSISKDCNGRLLSRETKTRFYKMRKLHNRFKFSSQKEKRLATGLIQVDKYVSNLGLARNFKEAASLMYRKAAANNLIRGRSVQMIAAAVVYTVCRMNSIPRTLDEVCEACSLTASSDKKKVAKAYKAIVKSLNLKLAPVRPEQYLSRFCSELNISPRTREEAIKIIRWTQNVDQLRSAIPAGVAAAAIYIASQRLKERTTQRRIADVVGVSEPTLRYRYHDLMTYLGNRPMPSGRSSIGPMGSCPR